MATPVSQRRSTIGARTKKLAVEGRSQHNGCHKYSSRKVEHLRKRAQSINEASNVAMAPSRRETAKDKFAPRMAVDTTPQDPAADAPRVDYRAGHPCRPDRGGVPFRPGRPSRERPPSLLGKGGSSGQKSAEMHSTASSTSKDWFAPRELVARYCKSPQLDAQLIYTVKIKVRKRGFGRAAMLSEGVV